MYHAYKYHSTDLMHAYAHMFYTSIHMCHVYTTRIIIDINFSYAYIHMYICIGTFIHMYRVYKYHSTYLMHAYACMFMYICIHVSLYQFKVRNMLQAHVLLGVHIWIYIYTHICIPLIPHLWTYVYMHVYIYIHIHTCTHSHRPHTNMHIHVN
jgi:hypothetical protein